MTTTVFTQAELAFLREPHLARLATIGPDGGPQVRPVGYLVNEDTGTIDIAGLDNPGTQKWRNVRRDGRVALVVDEGMGRQARSLEIRGIAEALPDVLPATAFPGVRPGVIRIHPRRIIPAGIEEGGPGSRWVPGGPGPSAVA